MLKQFIAFLLIFLGLTLGGPACARYAAIVINADTGQVIHQNDATQRWYPASLTKVMTLYLTFDAIKAGRLDLHDMLTASKHASLMPRSKLGLLPGQRITVEQAIMAVATRSANDAAVMLAEHLGGSEERFADMMTAKARQMDMSASSFENASGLPNEGQISSARDLALLSLNLINDFPEYYHYFSATEFHYKGRVLPNTNRILQSYPDADGLKTGFTCGSGFNLIASAKRNGQRVIGVLLGAHSSQERFQQMEHLLDLGFEKNHAASNGTHVAALKMNDFSPPPFQLVSNRCAGSAEQMGAYTESAGYEPITIGPPHSHAHKPRLARATLAAHKPRPVASSVKKRVKAAPAPRLRAAAKPPLKAREASAVKVRHLVKAAAPITRRH